MSEQSAANAPKEKPDFAPKLEFFATLSKDGRFVITKTVITTIKPARFFEKVLAGEIGAPASSAGTGSGK